MIHIKKTQNSPNDTVEIIQKWMACYYKRYSILTFILPISFFDVKFNFPYFRIYQFFSIFSFYEPCPHFFFVSFKVSLVRTLMRRVWLKTKERLVCFGWADEKCKYWWRSVGFTCKSVVVFPSFKPTLRSRNEIFCAPYSSVNFMYWLKSLSSKNFLRLSSPWVQIKKISSIYRNHKL